MNMADIPDRIADIFHGRTVFISGGTGFIGKALVEKLLRSTNVKKIYLLIREKKGKTPKERLQDLFNNVLFKSVLASKPGITNKCIPISGDVIETDLGISTRDRQILVNEVNFIFHSAASTRFDDSIKYAVTMNTQGTKYMLDLAEQCKALKLFIHVSTAYAFPSENKTMEKEYRPPANPHEVLNGLAWIEEEVSRDITKKTASGFSTDTERNVALTRKLLGKVPNSYTFSKALAEALVYEKVGKIPLIICRPAVVIPSFEDPFPGWFNNLQGPMGLFVGAGKGVIRCMYMDSKSYANLVPIDATVGGLLVFSWYHLTTQNPPYIFNLCVPQSDIRMSWEDILQVGKDIIETKIPFNGILWYPGGTMTKSRVYNKINFILFQLIPALFIDALLFILGYKPILYNIQMRIQKGAEMFEFYTTKAWDFETTNVETIREKLTDVERKIYIIKVDKIDVKEYLVKCMMSCRRNILKETDDMLPAARRNMKLMFFLDRFVKIAFFLLLGYYIYRFFQYF